jgi:hypothetical protein
VMGMRAASVHALNTNALLRPLMLGLLVCHDTNVDGIDVLSRDSTA